jgi:similar to stage IV sporulation protein
MLTYVLSWLRGYAVLHLSGGRQERFLNLALQRDIDVYDINWLADDLLEVKADWQELGALRKIAKITGCEMQIRRSQGLPFACKYLRRRKTFVAGVLVFALGLAALSQLVFAVRVLPQEELSQLSEETVLQQAAEHGVKPGAIFRRLQTDEIESQLKHEIPELSWVYIERQGTNVNIKVAERSIYPEELENATIGAIFANRDALIEDVLIKRGYAEVSHGQTVHKGELLVSPLEDGRADAIVRARVWYEGYGEGVVQEELVEPLGKSKFVYRLLGADGADSLILWGKAPVAEGENTSIKSEISEVKLALNGENFGLQVEKLTPQMSRFVSHSDDEAKAQALEQALASLREQIGDENQLLNQEVEYTLLDGGIWSANVIWECMEEIGVRKENK